MSLLAKTATPPLPPTPLVGFSSKEKSPPRTPALSFQGKKLLVYSPTELKFTKAVWATAPEVDKISNEARQDRRRNRPRIACGNNVLYMDFCGQPDASMT